MTTVQPIINTATHRGVIRKNNQNVVRSGARWALVADGMGSTAGHKAAAIVATHVGDLLDQVAHDHDLTEMLAHGVTRAEFDIETEILNNYSLNGMGSTIVAAYIGDQGRVQILNVGNSRCYVLSDGELTQITVDGSPKQLDNAITEHKLARPRRVNAEVSPGDRLLLCSNGLSNMIDDVMISDILNSGLDGETTAQTLIEAAMSAGGVDSISVAVIDIDNADEK